MALFQQSQPPKLFVTIFLCAFALGLVVKMVLVHVYDHAIVTLGSEQFDARVASNEAQRTKGLSGTAGLEKNEAMLFTFDGARQYVFWMKDMQYAIDIIWIRDGKIIDIAPRVPPAVDSAVSDLIKYAPRLPADRVVEVVVGTVDRLGIKINDPVIIAQD